MLRVVAYTDGACSGNPGPGGWGVLLQAYGDGELVKERELSGGESATTNNRMELTAAIQALQALKAKTGITVRTDSQYVKNGISNWIHGWKLNGWKTAGKGNVKNSDLWMQLDELQCRHEVRWEWVKGHADEPGNERADKLAREGMKPFL
ncbi:MAG: ribonuclease HI [Rhodobacteraceae bacterium]|nr:ribonuclease HI [Paracoccaceae bacterium]